MVERVVKIFIKNNIIHQQDSELYQYGLTLLIKKIFHIVTILLLGTICKKFICTAVFLVAYAGIRKYAGGYHAKSSKGCYACTGIVTSFSILLFYILEYVELFVIYIILGICAGAISTFSPQETSNRPLSREELTIYKKKTIKTLIIEGIICLLSLFFKEIINGIICAWVIETIMLLIGKGRQKT